MNEEVSRILDMLEAGKITATEAAELIRAIEVTEAKAEARAAKTPDLCAEIGQKFRTVARAVQRAQERQRRHAQRYLVWCGHHLKRKAEQERRRRAETKTTLERVVHVLHHSAMIGVEAKPESRLRDLLQGDQIAWDNAWFGLEEEFRLDIPPSDIREQETVQALADYLDRRLAPPEPPAAPEASAEPPPAPEPSKPARPRPPRPRRAKPKEA